MAAVGNDTIAAIATAPGAAGIGIVRISGPLAGPIAQQITGHSLKPRLATYCQFDIATYQLKDSGIALFFAAPHSFTGEDVVELQGHGGPVILDCLLQQTLALGARAARPGEFSERAFLNDKIDLAQAEAIADLIDSASISAARSASRSLQGEFSDYINQLVDQLIHLRVYVEAAIDFPEEEVDFLADQQITDRLQAIVQQLEQTLAKAQQGVLLREGMTVVIAGKPNAGKSSLLNCLAGKESAIVTDIAGTTRDVLREHIQIDGMPLHIVDTAGIRSNPDTVEAIGISKAKQQLQTADRILLVVDAAAESLPAQEEISSLLGIDKTDLRLVTVVMNKCDRIAHPTEIQTVDDCTVIYLSAKSGSGLDLLTSHLKASVGYSSDSGVFTARRRHLDALQRALDLVTNGQQQLLRHQAGELLAEDLAQAQRVLGEITGQVSPDDLLGVIFSSFCIGK